MTTCRARVTYMLGAEDRPAVVRLEMIPRLTGEQAAEIRRRIGELEGVERVWFEQRGPYVLIQLTHIRMHTLAPGVIDMVGAVCRAASLQLVGRPVHAPESLSS